MTFKVGPYRNFVEGYRKHPDQGIKACEKKLKKEPTNTLYLLAQAELLYRQRRYTEALESTAALKFSATDQLDEDLLLEIQHIIVQCQHATSTFRHTAGPQLITLWKQALDRAPATEATYIRQAMFNAAWRHELWDLAQNLFLRLQKEQPLAVKYHYAWIACAQLQATALPADDRIAQSLEQLAFRSLKSIVDNTVENKSGVRKLTDSHQWRLLVQIFMEQKKYEELKKTFNTKAVEPSHVHGRDVESVRTYLKTLEALNDHETIYNFALQSIQQYRDSLNVEASEKTAKEDMSWTDDWNLWQAMINAQGKCTKARSNINSIPEVALAILKTRPLQRNAARARLMCLMKYQRASLAEALIHSFSNNSTRRACFEDLKDFMTALNHQEEERFLNHIDGQAKSSSPWDDPDASEVIDQSKAKDWVMININALKFEYLICISKAPLPTKDSLEAFFSDALRMYKIALGIDKECGDEACILAVMALIKLHHFSRDFDMDEKDPTNPSSNGSSSKMSPQSYLIQAVTLLEYLRTNSPFNYSAALLLTLIAQMLNLVSLSAIALGSLNIKEVQHDTIGHVFWSRMSISHPYPIKRAVSRSAKLKSEYADPIEGISKAIDWFDLASDRTNRFMGDNLETIQFDQISHFNDFRCKIDRSFTRALYFLEQRRAARITEGLEGARDMPSLPPTFRQMTKDNRDFATIPSFEYQTTDTFDHFIVAKPRPSKYWLARHTVNDNVLTLLYSRPPHEPFLLPHLEADLSYLRANSEEIRYQLTISEQKVAPCWDLLIPLVKLLVLHGAEKPTAANEPQALLKKIQTWLRDTTKRYQQSDEDTERNVLPSNEALQGAYFSFEVIQAVALICNAASAAAAGKTQYTHHIAGAKTFPVDGLKKTKQAAQEAYDAVHNRAEVWRTQVKERGSSYVDAAIFGGVTGEDMQELFTTADDNVWSKDVIVNDIVESALDSIDGLCKVRMV